MLRGRLFPGGAVAGPVANRTPYASYTLQGDVLDAQTEQPIPHAVVFLDGYQMTKGVVPVHHPGRPQDGAAG